MDQFAVIRHQARALRTAANVSDSSTAIETAQAAASHRGLSIRRLAPDHPELEGGHGVLDRQYSEILVRNNLPDSELAEVIAHELGHFEVHDGPERGYYQLPPGYQDLVQTGVLDQCGVTRLAEVAVGAPFVGAVAGALLISQSIRFVSDGRRPTVVNLDLRAMQHRSILLHDASESVIFRTTSVGEPH
jgi:hypothetical protein